MALMDRQDAIDLLDNLIGMVDDNHGSDYDAALRMGIEALKAEEPEYAIEMQEADIDETMKRLRDARVTILPSAEPKLSRIEQELHGKTPEEQYEFIYWLLFKSFEATAYSNSRLAIIEWLRGGQNED